MVIRVKDEMFEFHTEWFIWDDVIPTHHINELIEFRENLSTKANNFNQESLNVAFGSLG